MEFQSEQSETHGDGLMKEPSRTSDDVPYLRIDPTGSLEASGALAVYSAMTIQIVKSRALAVILLVLAIGSGLVSSEFGELLIDFMSGGGLVG